MELLTYKDGEFILEDGCFSTIKKVFAQRGSSGDPWRAINPDDYATRDIKAAVEFRHLADKKAERVFNACFVKFYEAPLGPLPTFLDPHQIQGVNWILTRSRSYLAHAPGAGKTCEAITASIFAKGSGQTLFIVPPNLTINWQKEIIMWVEKMQPGEAFIISTVPESAEQKSMIWYADYIICPDSMITKPWVLSELEKLKLKLIAVDEASRFKEATSKRTIALFGGEFTVKTRNNKRVSKSTLVKAKGLIQNATHAVLMDGSPMPNRPMELWAPLFAMAPETIDFMAREDFGMKYCGPTINDWGSWEFKHSSNEAELKGRLTKDFMHVVGESELNHPERLRSILFMNEDPRTVEDREWEHKLLGKINLSNITDEDGEESELATYRRKLGLKKIPWIADYVSERLEKSNSEAILLFAWHREVVLGLCEALKKYRPLTVMGGTSKEDREIAFQHFNGGACRLLVGNIQAMGRGHNLQRATRVVFGEYSWTDEVNMQAEKRTSRKGNEAKSIRADYIVVPNSMDEVVLQAVFRGAKRVEKIIGGG